MREPGKCLSITNNHLFKIVIHLIFRELICKTSIFRKVCPEMSIENWHVCSNFKILNISGVFSEHLHECMLFKVINDANLSDNVLH